MNAETETVIADTVVTSSAVSVSDVQTPLFYAGNLMQIYFMGLCVGLVVAMLFWHQVLRIY